MARTEIDRGKLCVHLRRLRKDDLLDLLERAIEFLPDTRIAALVEGYVKPEELRPDGTAKGRLLQAAVTFREASLRGEYYEDFAVNSRNFMEMSRGTETWCAECGRLFDRCSTSAKKRPAETREAFDVLFGLLRHIDTGDDDIVFFADEGGSWQVGVDWQKVLPAYFSALATTAAPDAYAAAVRGVIDDFVDHDRIRYLKAARAAASSAQKKALTR